LESGKLFKMRDIEERLEEIERNERKWEILCSRVDNFENLNSRCNNNSSELEVVISKQPNELTGNSQQEQV
jgi:hypothetical protein